MNVRQTIHVLEGMVNLRVMRVFVFLSFFSFGFPPSAQTLADTAMVNPAEKMLLSDRYCQLRHIEGGQSLSHPVVEE